MFSRLQPASEHKLTNSKNLRQLATKHEKLQTN